jgi:predicted GIY-YIG superfamily endonuclease
MMFYVDVLQSESNTGLYIGEPRNLRRRFEEHQRGESISTKALRPWRLIDFEPYLSEADAGGREIYLKIGSGRRFPDKRLRNHFIRFPGRET